MSRERFQAARLTRPRMTPEQVKLNWHPLDRAAPWKTTPQTVFGNAGWRTRFRTTWATAFMPSRPSPRAS